MSEHEGGACHDDTREERLDSALREVAGYVGAGGVDAPECFNPAWLAEKTCLAMYDLLEVKLAPLEAEVERLKAVVAKQNEPAHVLAEAERLLRASLITQVTFCADETQVERYLDGHGHDPDDATHEIDGRATLAEAYAALIGGKT